MKNRDREKERDRKTETYVHTTGEKAERGQDGNERSEVTGSGHGLFLKVTRD